MIVVQLNIKGEISGITKAFTAATGWKESEVLGKRLEDYLCTEENLGIDSWSEIKVIINEENRHEPFDLCLKLKNGKPLHISLTVIKADSSIKNNKFLLVGNVITNEHLIEDHNDHQENMVFEYLEDAEDAIIIVNSNYDIVSGNKTWAEKLGFGKVPSRGIPLTAVLNPKAASQTLKMLESLTVEFNQTVFSTVLTHQKSGREIFFSITAACRCQEEKILDYHLILKDISEQIRTEQARNLYYAIAHHTIQSQNLDELAQNIYKEINRIIDSENFFIALFDPDKNDRMVSFPFVQEVDKNIRGANEREAGKGLTEYTARYGQPILLHKSEIRQLIDEGTVVLNGQLPQVWLGVPLKTAKRTIGIISVQSYKNKSKFSQRDLRLLDFASSQIALSIDMLVTQEELKGQTARLNALFESSSHLIWTVNRSMELTSFNKNYFDAIFSIYDTSSIPQEGSDNNTLPFDSFWQKQYDSAFEGKQLHFEIKLKDVQGNDVWKEIFLNPIVLDGNQIEEVSGLAHDISENKLAQQAIKDSEEKFRTIFESFQDVYYQCTMDGKVVLVSPSVLDLTGYTQKEVDTKPFTTLVSLEEELSELLPRLQNTRKIQNINALVHTKDGRSVECLCNIRLMLDKDEPLAFEAVVRDVSHLSAINRELRKAKDEAEQSLLVKEQFLANMSHEIRTPMNGVIGMIDLLMNTPLDVEQQSYMNTIRNSSETLLHILNEILDISKIEAGKLGLKTQVFSLKNTLKKVIDLFSPKASTSMVKLNTHIDKNLPEFIIADEMRIMQVLSNLMSNAIKFTNRGGAIDVGVYVKNKKGDSMKVKIDVRDSGIGISKEDQGKLFTNFTQLDNSTTRAHTGTGLGLAISKELVQMMGGDIAVASNPGFGSTFSFTFKAIKEEKGPLQPSLTKHPSTQLSTGLFQHANPKILVVDDNLVNRDVAGEILKKAGCRVDLASDGLEAVFKAKRKKYDLIFMDIQMPELDGIEATRKIKANGKPAPTIVAMTAYSEEKDKKNFEDQGLDDYLAKPVRANHLLEMVARYMDLPAEKSISQPTIKIDEIVDKNVLEQLKKYGGTDVVNNALKEFQEETAIILQACREALIKEDYIVIQKHMHTLKGTSGTLGINRMAAQAISIESMLKKKNLNSLEEDFEELFNRFVQFQENFTNIIS